MSEQIEIREKQADVAQALLSNIRAQMHAGSDTHADGPVSRASVKAAIAQMNMGEGKTRVVLPMLVLALARPVRAGAEGGSATAGSGLQAMRARHVPRIVFLDALLQESAAALRLTLTGALLVSMLIEKPAVLALQQIVRCMHCASCFTM